MEFKTVANFIHEGHSNQEKSITFKLFASKAGCVRSSMLVQKCISRILAKIHFSAQTTIKFVVIVKISIDRNCTVLKTFQQAIHKLFHYHSPCLRSTLRTFIRSTFPCQVQSKGAYLAVTVTLQDHIYYSRGNAFIYLLSHKA